MNNKKSQISLEEKSSFDNLYTNSFETESKFDISKMRLTTSRSTALHRSLSITDDIQSVGKSHQIVSFMTKETLSAIYKVYNKTF